MPYIGNVAVDFNVDTHNITNSAVTAVKLSPSVGSNGQVLSVDANGALQWTTDAAGMPTSGGTFTGNVLFNDDVKARFGHDDGGSGGDVDSIQGQLWWDETNNYFNLGLDTGSTHKIDISAQTVEIRGVNRSSNMAIFRATGATDLFYGTNKKFETSNTGVTVTGTVAATAYTGDGSALTGISAGTALTGSTNNTVCTVTGANAIQGEANLTFDGSNLVINRDANSAGGISITNTNNAQGSQIAQLSLSGGDNAYAEISMECNGNNHKIQNDGNGNLDILDGSDNRVRLDTSGRWLVGATSGANNGKIQGFIAHGSTAGESGITSADLTAMAAGVGGEISFYGKTDGGSGFNYLGHIRGIKENATNTNTACALTFHTRPTLTAPQERMRISSDGKIGIGTTSPAEKLDVNGNINLPTINTWIKGGGHSVLQVDATMSYLYGGSGGAQFRKADNSSALVQILDSGNIGIGTTSPSDLVHLLKSHNGHTRLVVQNNWGSNATAQLKLISPTDEFAIVKYASGDAYQNLSNAGNIVFQINGNEKARITDDGIKLPSGKGIDFSANMHGSGMTSELLDDYEEGTWTPAINTGFTVGYSSYNAGTYIKVGRMCYYQAYVRVDSVSGSSGESYGKVKGLPFACKSDGIIAANALLGWFYDMVGALHYAYHEDNTTDITLLGYTAGGSRTHLSPAQVWQSSARLSISGCYETD